MKPIIMSTEDVRAVLDGRKTMTRRVIKPQTVTHNTPERQTTESLDDFMRRNKEDFELLAACAAPYQLGDILWVREKWRTGDVEYRDCMRIASIQYADGEKGPRVFWYDNSDVGIYDYCIYNKTGWRPSIHMPREAARLFLRVTGVRVERLKEITLDDIEREGLYCDTPYTREHFAYGPGMSIHWVKLWDSVNAKRGHSWDSNPWVWVYTFERITKEEAEHGH